MKKKLLITLLAAALLLCGVSAYGSNGDSDFQRLDQGCVYA